MSEQATPPADRGLPTQVFLYVAIGVLAVTTLVFALLWLLNPLASGAGGRRAGRSVAVHSGSQMLRITEGMSVEGPKTGHEAHLASEQFDELTKVLLRLTQSARSAEQAREYFESEPGSSAKPAVRLAFPRRSGAIETIEVYAVDARRQLCYCRLASTGEPLAVTLSNYQAIAGQLAKLAGGAAGSLSVPYFTELGDSLRAALGKLDSPLLVTTVSSDPRQYLVQLLSNPSPGGRRVSVDQPDPTTVVASARLPDDQAMARSLAEAMARASEQVQSRHLSFATQARDVQEFAQAIKRSALEIQDSLVLQYRDRMRIIPNMDMLMRVQGGSEARFEGEKVLEQALGDLIAERGLLYFASGHGERRIADREAQGLSQAAEQLAARGFHTAPLDLSNVRGVPKDCQVLVILGPRKPYEAELEKAIASYLDGGGRMALLLDPPLEAAPLAATLKRYGVAVPEPNKVLRIQGRFMQPVVIEVELNRKLDFVRRWARETNVFFTACGLSVGAPAEGVACEALCAAQAAQLGRADAPPTCLLAAVRPKAKATGPKMLVFSDVDAFTNQIVRQMPGNTKLLIDALAWLAE